LTQPAVSHQVKALEDLYGLPLFERKTVPLRITPAGQRLLQLARALEQQVGEAERDLSRIAGGRTGQLRIAVECHSCFDWLMPSMDAFRERWPEVEQDLVSGFHADPVGLLHTDRADLVIVSHALSRPNTVFHPLFRYEVSALVACGHPLAKKPFLTARDFSKETLITYPIPDDRIDILRQVLIPARVEPRKRRTTELTVAILQLVASHRGIAAMPRWAVQPFLDRGYVAARPVGKRGLRSALYAATSKESAASAWMRDFIDIMCRVSFGALQGITPL
jgi:LysR family transcriptional regulator for metE and metH